MRDDGRRFEIEGFWLSRRRNSDQWCRTWFDRTSRQTRRASLGTADLREAKLRLAEWVTLNQTIDNATEEEIPIETILVRYFEQHGRNIRSADVTERALRYWSEFYAGALLSEIRDQRDEFVAWLRDKGHSDAYIQRIITAGKAAINWAYHRGEIKTVPPFKNVTVDSEAGRDRVLTLEERAALIDAAKSDHLFMYIMLGLSTMARPEAILELRRFQLDFDNNTIQLNPPGRKQTKKRRPIVPMTNTIKPWLQSAESEYLVNYRGKPLKKLNKAWRTLREKAGLSKDVVPYTLRHTMATELFRRRVNPIEVQYMLGHKDRDFRTTERYVHYDPSYLGAAVDAIDEYFSELDKLVKRQLVWKDQESLRVSSVLVSDGNQRQNMQVVEKWSGKRDSNSRPQPWQGCALPTELFPRLSNGA